MAATSRRCRQWVTYGLALTLGVACAALLPDPTQPGRLTVTVDEGTNVAATVSPDRATIVFDLQGTLWSIPFAGGAATRLTDPFLEPARPDFSPRGDLVAFQAYKGGTFHIWTMKPDGTDLRQLTTGHGDHREPRFSPDGSTIAFSSDRAVMANPTVTGSYDIWTVGAAGGEPVRVTSAEADEFEPTWSPDGQELAFVSGTGSTGTTIQGIRGGAVRTIASVATGFTRLNSPSWSPDGTKLAYVQFGSNRSQLVVESPGSGAPAARIGTFDDVFPFYPVWLSDSEVLYTADGRIRVSTVPGTDAREIPFTAQFELNRQPYPRKEFDFDSRDREQVLGLVGPSLSPDGRQVVFAALNQIWVMEIGGRPRALTTGTYFHTDPSWSPDGARVAYSSDEAGTMDLYVHELATGAARRVTSLPGAEYASAWSRDGASLAFQDEAGATHTIELASGTVRQVLPALFAPGKPTWSADGRTIAVSALKPYTRRFREGTSQILTVDLASGTQTYREVVPFESFSTRGEDGPAWSPDGTAIAGVVKSTLWILPVGPDGAPTGPAQRINDEVTDAPSWSGDSQTLLYLSNGELRLVSRDGSNLRTVPVDLEWAREQPEVTGRTVVHAGRLWDGRGAQVQTDVDVLVLGNRIVAVRPHEDELHQGGTVVDASGLTVLPGLWESHTHEWIAGRAFGARLGRVWLAYGVTTLQSVGDPAYRAMETRESYDGGARVGPRFFATGEALDGERIYYNFMRPVTSEDQLALENARAKALDYDMVKTYVRLPHEWQQKAAEFAHASIGTWAASHYMLPGMSYAMDGMTHVSATTRLGFSYTRSSGGVSYRDMTDLFAMSRMFDISTTFNPVLMRDDPALADDPRLAALYPPWELAAIRAQRDQLLASDPTLSLDSLAKEERTVQRIFRPGGNMLAGTDSPLDRVAIALHLNLRSQVRFGMQPWEALQTVTSRTARAFGHEEDLGTVTAGKLADLLLVEGDPLTRIEDLVNVRSVIKNGRIYTPEGLMAPFAPAAAGAATAALRVEAASNPIAAPVPADPRASGWWWHDPANLEHACSH
jgi:Tol biopolymer transport system component/cytosine/adenosine deaminase-related metal-dependent hydrolase